MIGLLVRRCAAVRGWPCLVSITHMAIGFVVAGAMVWPASASSASALEGGVVLWRQTFDADGPNVRLGDASPDPRAFFSGVSHPERVFWAATDADTDASVDGDVAAKVGARFAQVSSLNETEVAIVIDGFHGLVETLNALPPGRYDLTMDTVVRDKGRHVRRLDVEAKDRPGGKVRSERRWINPDVGGEFARDHVSIPLVVLEGGVEPTAADLAEAKGEDDHAVVFVEGLLHGIKVRHWIGGRGRQDSVAIADIAFRSGSIASMAEAEPSRVLSVVETSTPGTVFMFHRSRPGPVVATLSNLAPRDMEVDVAMRLTPWAGGAALDEARASLTVPAGGKADASFTPELAGLPYGVYVASWSFTDPDSGATLAEASVQLGVCSDTPLGKARDGEFLFGLDTSLHPAHTIHPEGLAAPPLLEWTRWLGTDIVRGGFYGWSQNFRNNTVEERLAEVEAGRSLYEQYDLRVVKMLDPPDDKFLKHMETIETRMVDFAERVAREHAGWLTYYEIGNEPDLPGFYEGPMSRYVRQYLDLHAAVHRGNPDAIVMNGGFAYGVERMEEFLASVRPDQIEALAYHAHGKGAEAERMAFRRLKALAVEHGLGDKPLIQTESGLNAGHRRQEIEKARTCIQKMVYAQSQDVPLFLWFRLWVNNRGYGNTRDMLQPRPALLAYRAMVETLRHHRLERMIEAFDPSIELYLFRQIDGPGRVIVGWTNEAGLERSLRFDLAASAAALGQPQTLDLFGNPTPVIPGRGGVVTATFGESPSFLRWDTNNTDHAVAVDPGFLLQPAGIELVPEQSGDVTLTLRNPWDERLVGQLSVEPASSTSLSVTPAAVNVSLAPGQVRDIAFRVDAGPRMQDIVWPESWQVFTRVRTEAVDLSDIDEIPETLPGAHGGQVHPVRAYPRDHRIDLAAIGHFIYKQDQRADAVAFAEVVSDGEQVVTIGAAGDYWMAWYANGRPVFDTMATGNGATYSILAHTFDVPLRKGRNVLAVRVLAGSHNWRLVIGPPEPVRQALGQPPRDALRAVLRVGDEAVLDASLPVHFREPIARVAPGFDRTDAADASAVLADITPFGVLTDRHIENYFERIPGDARWYHGDADLSATLWAFRDDRFLHLVATVADQDHRSDAPNPEQRDRLAVALATDSDANPLTITLIDADPPALLGAPDGAVARVERDDERGTTRYRLALPLDALPGGGNTPLRLNTRVYDRDADTLKQHAQWRPGFAEPRAPDAWRLLRPE